MTLRFNPPPGWKVPPHPWAPSSGFKKDPDWPEAPLNWNFWVELSTEEIEALTVKNGESDSGSSSLQSLDTSQIENGPIALDDRLLLQEAGIYEYHHPLENAVAYQEELEILRHSIAIAIKNNLAVSFARQFVFENSIAKGEKFARDLSALALHAFNQEVENTLRTLKPGTLQAAKKRVETSASRISRIGKLTELEITSNFIELRMKELELTADYLQKVQEEREAHREERERLREEQKALRELEAQKEKLEKERMHYLNALFAMKEQGNLGEAAVLESRIQEIDEALKVNDFRINNVRAGYVYVISNEGAFGPGVVKIGMTRRLEPMDRINELGDASVPFRFSVHALFFSEDAVSLEASLHSHFDAKRLNLVNPRKEFFFASPAEVREVLLTFSGQMLDFDEKAANDDFLASSKSWPAR